MAIRKTNAPDAVYTEAYAVMERWHPEIHEAELKLTIMFVEDIDKRSLMPSGRHGLRVRGHAAGAMVRKSSSAERVLGAKDAVIEIDKLFWEKYSSPEQKLSLLDHELTHVNLVYDRRTGLPKPTIDGRPDIRLIPHDYEAGIFMAPIRRHGLNAVDMDAVRVVVAAADSALRDHKKAKETE